MTKVLLTVDRRSARLRSERCSILRPSLIAGTGKSAVTISSTLDRFRDERALIKRAISRAVYRRSYEDVLRWARKNAVDGAITLEQLTAAVAARNERLDETETADEHADREALDNEVLEEEMLARARTTRSPAAAIDRKSVV